MMLSLKKKKKKVALLVNKDFEKLRKRSLATGICYWSQRRDVDIDLVSSSDLKPGDKDKYAFAYRMLTSIPANEFRQVPQQIPLVMDLATPIDVSNDAYAGWKLLIRNAFGTKVKGIHPEMQVPMLAPPLRRKKGVLRDVIVLDVKAFHNLETHLYVSSLLASISTQLEWLDELLGQKTYIYFTSFFDYNLYRKAFDVFESSDKLSCGNKQKAWDIIEKRIIAPLEDHDDYLDLLQRCRLLLTEHGDIVDMDMAHALCLGVPTLTYKRLMFAESTGFQCSALQGVKTLDSKMPERLIFANKTRVREEWGLKQALQIGEVPSWNVDDYEALFLSSWDAIYDWAVNGVVNKKLNVGMTKGSWNKGVTRRAEMFNEAKAIVNYYEK